LTVRPLSRLGSALPVDVHVVDEALTAVQRVDAAISSSRELEVEDLDVARWLASDAAFGIARTRGCWISQRSATWPGVLPWFAPISCSTVVGDPCRAPPGCRP
jgi:hypothetical protein